MTFGKQKLSTILDGFTKQKADLKEFISATNTEATTKREELAVMDDELATADHVLDQIILITTPPVKAGDKSEENP